MAFSICHKYVSDWNFVYVCVCVCVCVSVCVCKMVSMNVWQWNRLRPDLWVWVHYHAQKAPPTTHKHTHFYTHLLTHTHTQWTYLVKLSNIPIGINSFSFPSLYFMFLSRYVCLSHNLFPFSFHSASQCVYVCRRSSQSHLIIIFCSALPMCLCQIG